MDFGYQLGKDVAGIQETLTRIESRLTALERKQPCRCGGDKQIRVPPAKILPVQSTPSTATVQNYIIEPTPGLVPSPDEKQFYVLMAFTLGGDFHDPPDDNLWKLVTSEGKRLQALNQSIQPGGAANYPVNARPLIGYYNVTTGAANFVLVSIGLGQTCCLQPDYI